MTDRPTAATITDAELAQLYADLAHAQAEAARWGEAESADVAASSYAGRVEELQTVIDRVRALRDDLRGITGARWIADMLDKILDPPGPAATEATRPATWLLTGTRDLSIPAQHRFTLDPEEERAATERARRIADEAQRASEQLAALNAPHTGLVVQPYRNDQGRPAWVFRCWGTDTCDGYLSLDHHSQQWAERARDRHLAEDHPAKPVPCPSCRRADQAGLAPAEQHDACAKEQQ